jgi:hypothetical protein
MAAIGITYNHIIGNRSNQIAVSYQGVIENIECEWIAIVEIELAEYLGGIYTKRVLQVTLWTLKRAIIVVNSGRILDFGKYYLMW